MLMYACGGLREQLPAKNLREVELWGRMVSRHVS